MIWFQRLEMSPYILVVEVDLDLDGVSNPCATLVEKIVNSDIVLGIHEPSSWSLLVH